MRAQPTGSPFIDGVFASGRCDRHPDAYPAAGETIASITWATPHEVAAAVLAAMLANFYSTGQIGSNGTQVFVQPEVKDAFAEKLLARTRALVLGDPLDEATQIGPLVTAAHMAKALEQFALGRREAGTGRINSYNLTPIEMPFGGAKRSGIGRENGRAAIGHYSQLESVYVGMTPVDAPY